MVHKCFKINRNENVVISVETSIKKVLYLAFEISVMFQMFHYLSKE